MQGILPQDRQRVCLQRQKSMESGLPHVTDFRTQRPDGTLRMLRGRGRFLYDRQGRPTRFIGVTFDVSGPRDEDDNPALLQRGSHPLELIADNCMAAHELARRNDYNELAHILRMALIEVGASLAKLGRAIRFDS